MAEEAETQEVEKAKESQIKHLFASLSLDEKEDSLAESHGKLEDVDYKFQYFWRQTLVRNYSMYGWHSFVWLAWTIMQKRWETRTSRNLDSGCFADYLCEMQAYDSIHRELCAERMLATLECMYCQGGDRAKREKDRADRVRREKQLVRFKQNVPLSDNFLKSVVPENLINFIKEVSDERETARVFLTTMVRVLFTPSVEVDKTEVRAAKLKQYVEQMIRMSARRLPCLTGEHPPLASGNHSVEMVIQKLTQLPTAFVIPELCTLVFRSTRWEFLQDVCASLLTGPESREDIKEYVSPGIVQPRSQSASGLFADILDRVLEMMGKAPVRSLLEVACASTLLLETAFNQRERIEIHALLTHHLGMLLYLHEATTMPGDSTPAPVLEEIKVIKEEVDLIFNGTDFYHMYFDPQTKITSSNEPEEEDSSSCVLH